MSLSYFDLAEDDDDDDEACLGDVKTDRNEPNMPFEFTLSLYYVMNVKKAMDDFKCEDIQSISCLFFAVKVG